jgi:cytochrome c biogenesis protein CcmG/thiol:disulfide interchange protein DsbE
VLSARGFCSVIVTVIVALAILVVFLFALQAPGPPPAPTVIPLTSVMRTATLAADANTVASVDGDPISHAEWQKAVAIDRAMSQLAGQTTPDAEVTLDRLINQRLVLRQAGNKISASDANATERLASLEQNWRADDAAVDRALASANLSRQDLLAEIKRLLIVEAYLKQHQDPTAWLAAQRAQARVGVLAELAPAPPITSAAQVVVPTSVVQAPTHAVAAQAPTPTTNIPVGSALGQLAFDFSLDDTSGQRIKLSDLRGHPVVINFWASWCPPCRQELPALQSAYQRFHDQGVILLGVNVRESAEAVQNFAPQFGLTFPLLLDQDGAVSERYQVRGTPTTVFLDAEGIVRARHVGPLTEDQFAEYVTPLLTARPPRSPKTSEVSQSPDFSLPRESGQMVRLSDYRDQSSVVLVFYRGQT